MGCSVQLRIRCDAVCSGEPRTVPLGGPTRAAVLAHMLPCASSLWGVLVPKSFACEEASVSSWHPAGRWERRLEGPGRRGDLFPLRSVGNCCMFWMREGRTAKLLHCNCREKPSHGLETSEESPQRTDSTLKRKTRGVKSVDSQGFYSKPAALYHALHRSHV